MDEFVERAVAQYLHSPMIDWESLKPVTAFVILWNRLEEQHGGHLSLHKLETSINSTARNPSFTISPYERHAEYFQKRYTTRPELLDDLFRGRGETNVESRVNQLVAGTCNGPNELLMALMMIPYRIRNNLFHGRKGTCFLYSQVDLFNNANAVLCQFQNDLC